MQYDFYFKHFDFLAFFSEHIITNHPKARTTDYIYCKTGLPYFDFLAFF